MTKPDKQNTFSKLAYSYAPVLVSCLICITLSYTGWLTSFENGLDEAEAELTRSNYRSDILVVEIDHASLKALPGWPWPRRYYAEVIKHLTQAGADHIFLDIDFSSDSRTVEDKILANALKKTRPGSVLMPTFLQYSNSGNSKYLTLNKPALRFRDSVTAVSVNVIPDEDGLVRRITLLSEFAGETLPTAAILLNHYQAFINESMRLNFRIMPDSFRRISFHNIYSNNFNFDDIKNKNIIIGATALELSDQIAVPVYKSLSGPIVQALAYQTLANGKLIALSPSVSVIIILLLCYPAWRMFYRAAWRTGLWRLIGFNSVILVISLVMHAGFNALLITAPILFFTSLSYTFFLFSKIDLQLYRILTQGIAINEKDAMMSHVIKNTSEGIIILNDSLKITSINSAACKIFNDIESNLTGMSIHLLLPEVDFSNIDQYHKNQLETDAIQSDGDRLPVQVTMNQLQKNDSQIYTIFIHDISERKAQQERLNYQVTHDSLTGLNNRAYLITRTDMAISAYQKNKQPAILFMIDLNNFKSINDTLGHSTGDSLLVKLGSRLKTLLSEDTCVSRLGGDEFSILTKVHLNTDELDLYLRRLQRLISEPIELSDMSLTIDAAIGVARIPDHAVTTSEIMVAADVAMYRAKNTQRSYSIYNPKIDYHTKRNLSISNDIKRAILHEQLLLQYQPKIDMATNHVTGLEALIRWQHPELGLIDPDEFIPIVENSSLIKPVTMFALETAVRKQKELSDRGIDISISVNISAKLLDDNNLATDITKILTTYNVPPEAIMLEITESAAISGHEQTLVILNKLIQNKLKLSIDDFGTSNASFSYLKQLPAKELKIDKMFITNICHEKSDKVISASIIRLAHVLDMQVVAEGIEDKNTYLYLKSIGCDIAQGYWISRPLPEKDIVGWIIEWEKRSKTAAVSDIAATQ